MRIKIVKRKLIGIKMSFVKGERTIGSKTREEYLNISKTEKNLLARHGNHFDENSIEYFEELMIDFDRSIEISEILINKNLSDYTYSPFSVNNLPIVLLAFGIGVAKRSASEIAILYKQPENTFLFKKIINDFETHERNIEDLEIIKNLFWEYINGKKDYKIQL